MRSSDILKIASDPQTCPVLPWQLREEVENSAVVNQVLRFARAVQRPILEDLTYLLANENCTMDEVRDLVNSYTMRQERTEVCQ